MLNRRAHKPYMAAAKCPCLARTGQCRAWPVAPARPLLLLPRAHSILHLWFLRLADKWHCLLSQLPSFVSSACVSLLFIHCSSPGGCNSARPCSAFCRCSQPQSLCREEVSPSWAHKIRPFHPQMFLKLWNHVWNYHAEELSFCQIRTAGCNSGTDPHHIKTRIIFVLHHKKKKH